MSIYDVNKLPVVIPIGVQTENGVEPVGFDIRAWQDVWDDIKVNVWLTRPGEDAAYPAADTELVGTVLYWYPSEADTAIHGNGKVELLGLTEDKRKLSGWCETNVRPTSLATTQEMPEAVRPWVDQVMLAAAQAEAAVEKMPSVGENGNWHAWDANAGEYVDTGKPSRGEQGLQGIQGIPGQQGIQGERGLPGERGLTGERGPAGNPGKDGTSVTVASVATSSADGGANVVTFSDGKTVTILNGSKGSQGIQGVQGPAGSPGKDGRDGVDGDTRVYIGSDNPPEDAELWVDPEGTVNSDDLPQASEENAGVVMLDATLTKQGAAADAKAVGAKVTALSEEIAKLPTTGGGAAVQSDWSVNDETDPAYVKNRTHREEPMYNLEWDGDTTGRFMIPLDIVGATGYVAVHVSHNAYSIEELIGAVIHFTDGYVLYINKSNLITEYPGAIVQRDMAVISVTDSAAITAALGSTVEIPEGMYFMYKPDEGYRATKMVGPLVAYAIPPKYMPELKQAYPQAATCDILLHMFDGEIPEKAFVGDKETVRVKSKFFTTIGKRAFAGCHNIVDVILPNATEIAFRAFEGCGALTTVDLHSIMELGDGAFDSGDALKTFIIRNEDTVAKAGAYVLGMEYTNRGEYYIYVPRALVDSYKAAENWSIYDSRFRALEDYTVDGTITGELDESKI